MGFVPPVRVDLVHFLELAVAVADELAHALGFGEEALVGGQADLRLGPGPMPFDLRALRGIGDLAGAADAGELGGAEAMADAVSADDLGEGADLAAGGRVEGRSSRGERRTASPTWT